MGDSTRGIAGGREPLLLLAFGRETVSLPTSRDVQKEETMIRRSSLYGAAFAVLWASTGWADFGKEIRVSCSDAITETVGQAAESRLTVDVVETHVCNEDVVVDGATFLVSWGPSGAGHGHLSFTLYDRDGQQVASLSARAKIGQRYSLYLLTTEGPAGEISRDGENLFFRVDADRFAQGRVEIETSGLIEAEVRSSTVAVPDLTCYQATVNGAGVYRIAIPFTVRLANAAC
jgi:hypothetical protein